MLMEDAPVAPSGFWRAPLSIHRLLLKTTPLQLRMKVASVPEIFRRALTAKQWSEAN